MTVIELDPRLRGTLPPGAPEPLVEDSTDVGEKLDAWYQFARRQGDQVLFRPQARVYRTTRPIVFNAPNVSVVGHAGAVTRFVTPGMVLGDPSREKSAVSSNREFGNFWVQSLPFFAKELEKWSEFDGVGLTVNNLFRSALHDIHCVGFSKGFVVQERTSRTHFDRLVANYCRNVGFELRGSATAVASDPGSEWLADCRWNSCESDSDWKGGKLTDVGWLLREKSIGDQFFTHCGSLATVRGWKVLEPASPGGYRRHVEATNCFGDYATEAAFDIRSFAEWQSIGGFVGVSGVVLVRVKDSTFTDLKVGQMRGAPVLRDGFNVTECDSVTVRGCKIRSFGQGINLPRSWGCDIDGNSFGESWDGTPATADGHGIRVTGGGGHTVRHNRIDDRNNRLVALIADEGSAGSRFDGNVKWNGEPILVPSATPI